ncbi:MAG TPA: FxSxx-COOH system tetratricopeptide repeat protein, partial [Tepidisphaeraceae bacterium]|nr:FxSxx-COOH system tetratricopeptide repeat protein [Tepidisphaeraceae bacterium]
MSTTSSTATTQAWNVPHARDPHFVGRDDVFARLWGRFSASSGPARVQGLCGLGGVGKTAIAAEYAYRYGPFYDTVWWVRAEAPSTLASDYAALAPHVGVTAGEDAAVDTVRDAVRRALDHRAGWLLIFDNVGRPEDVRPYLPTRGGGHVLVTSRTTDWAGVAHTTTLLGLSREEAVQLLRGRTNRAGTEEDAARVARVLGDLPLALEHAAASIAQSRGTFTGYLREYEAAWEQQLAERRAPGGYPPSVVITNDMAFRQARRTHPVAADLLTLCAFFAPEDIGLDWLSAAAGAAEPEALQRAAADPASLAGVAADLRRHGLAGGTSEALSVHRLVRDLTRSRLDHGEATRWRAAALRVAAAAFEFDRGLPSTWRRARAVLPPLLAAAGHASVADADPLATADAYNA